MNTATASPTDDPNRSQVDHETDHEMDRAAAARLKMGWGQKAVVALLLDCGLGPAAGGVLQLLFGRAAAFARGQERRGRGGGRLPRRPASHWSRAKPTRWRSPTRSPPPWESARASKDSVAVAQPPTMMRPLVLPGSTASIPVVSHRIRARFAPARVVEMAQVQDRSPKTGHTEFRDLRPGDHVSKGDLLGVFYSVDVGSKKNDLLRCPGPTRARPEDSGRGRETRRSCSARSLCSPSVRRCRGTAPRSAGPSTTSSCGTSPRTRSTRFRAEAKKISADKDAWFKTPEGRWVNREKQANGGKGALRHSDDENPWGRVTLRTPIDGVVIEYNVHKGEMVVDNTVNLFQIADVSRLLVKANCPEDQLPTLEALDRSERRWTVRTVGARVGRGTSRNHRRDQLHDRPQSAHGGHQGVCRKPREAHPGGTSTSPPR